MPTGAEGRLGLARPGAALADERGLLVTGEAGDQRGAVERAGRADRSRGVDDLRQHRLGDAEGLQHLAIPTRAVGEEHPGHPGVGGVGHVELSVRERPGHPGVDRPEGQLALFRPRSIRVGGVEERGHLGGRGVRCDPDPLSLELEAGAHRAQVLPAEARRRPARRWRVPRRWSRRAGWRSPPRPPARLRQACARRRSRTAAAMATGSNSTRPGRGVVGRTGTWWTCSTVRVGAHHRAAHPGGADVDDEDAHGQGTGPNGLVQAELAGVEDARAGRARA